MSGQSVDAAVGRTAREITEQRRRLAEIDKQIAQLNRSGGAAQTERAGLERQRILAEPTWLLWGTPEALDPATQAPPEELAEQSRPRVLASLTNGVPLLVERRVGRGRVLLMTGGFSTSWSTLALTNTMLVFDRIFRDLLRQTFPRRNMTTDEHLLLPLSAAERVNRLVLSGAGHERPLGVDALGAERYAVTVGNVVHRGSYKIVARGAHDAAQSGPGLKLWELPLAVNGPAEESNLVVAPRVGPRGADARKENVLLTQQQVESGTVVGIAGQDAWKWLMAAALACLLLELAILALPSLKREASA
jgi:hypothetical protein